MTRLPRDRHRRAADALLDEKLFLLNAEDYRAFLDLVDEPPKATKDLKRLLSTKAPWET